MDNRSFIRAAAIIAALMVLVFAAVAFMQPKPADAMDTPTQDQCQTYGCLFGHHTNHYDRDGNEEIAYGIANDLLPDGPDGRFFVQVLWPMVRADYRFDSNRYDAWMPLAQCESGNNPSINTGNGYHGLVQFSPSTWRAYGGEEFAAYAYQATAIQQLAVAERVLWAGYGPHGPQGRGAWPGCLHSGHGAPYPPQ